MTEEQNRIGLFVLEFLGVALIAHSGSEVKSRVQKIFSNVITTALCLTVTARIETLYFLPRVNPFQLSDLEYNISLTDRGKYKSFSNIPRSFFILFEKCKHRKRQAALHNLMALWQIQSALRPASTVPCGYSLQG